MEEPAPRDGGADASSPPPPELERKKSGASTDMEALAALTALQEAEPDDASPPPSPPLTRQQVKQTDNSRKSSPKPTTSTEDAPSAPMDVDEAAPSAPVAGPSPKDGAEDGADCDRPKRSRCRSSNRRCSSSLVRHVQFLQDVDKARRLLVQERERAKAAAEKSNASNGNAGSQSNPAGGKIIFPSAYGMSRLSSPDSYGPHHNSSALFPASVLNERPGVRPREREAKPRGAHAKAIGPPPPKDSILAALCPDMLHRSEANAYGYGCPLLLDPKRRARPRRVVFKATKTRTGRSALRPHVFAAALAARANALSRFQKRKADRLAREAGAGDGPGATTAADVGVEGANGEALAGAAGGAGDAPTPVEKMRERQMRAQQIKTQAEEAYFAQVLEGLDKEHTKHKARLDAERRSAKGVVAQRRALANAAEDVRAELEALRRRRKEFVGELKHLAAQQRASQQQSAGPPEWDLVSPRMMHAPSPRSMTAPVSVSLPPPPPRRFGRANTTNLSNLLSRDEHEEGEVSKRGAGSEVRSPREYGGYRAAFHGRP